MKLVEQHIIDQQDPRFAVIDPACFASKNLYNAALYILRQSFFKHERVPTYAKLAHTLKDTPEFRALPAKVPNGWCGRPAVPGTHSERRILPTVNSRPICTSHSRLDMYHQKECGGG
jgi:hypothetical protein